MKLNRVNDKMRAGVDLSQHQLAQGAVQECLDIYQQAIDSGNNF